MSLEIVGAIGVNNSDGGFSLPNLPLLGGIRLSIATRRDSRLWRYPWDTVTVLEFG